MDDAAALDRLVRMGVALAIGLTVGLERGWHERQAREGSRIAGWRTFGLIGLGGGVWADLASSNLIVLALALLAVAAILAAAHWQEVLADGDRGTTTLMAAIVTFGLGGLAGAGHGVEGAAGAVVTAYLLSVKSMLHRWLERLTEAEFSAVLRFLLISVVFLPVLPDRGMGPYEALNPHSIWLTVVVLAGISFTGYAAIRIWGERAGLMLTAVLGGIVASTALALNFARSVVHRPGAIRLLAAGIVAASGISFIRTAVLIGIFQMRLLPVAGLPLAAMVAASALAAWLLYCRQPETPEARCMPVENPLELGTAFTLGLILAVALLGGEWLRRRVGAAGLAGFAAVTGTIEIDALTISLAQMAGEGLAKRTATFLLLLGLAANGVLKVVAVYAIAGASLAWRVAASFIAVAAAAGAAILVI